MSEHIKIAPGVVVKAKKTNYKIESILGLDEFAATNLETHQREIIQTGEISLENEPEQRGHGRPDIRNVAPEVWAKAEKVYDAAAKLLVKNHRSRAEVEEFAKEHGFSTATAYRKLKAAQVIESPITMLRRTRLERPSLSFGMLTSPVHSELKPLEKLVLLTAQRLIEEGTRCTDTAFCIQVMERCMAVKEKKPHPNTIRKLISRLEPRILLSVRRGRKAGLALSSLPGEFSDKELPYQIFQIDHTRLNVIVVDSEHRRPIGRAWITLLIELYSRVVPGFAVSLDAPSVNSISSAIRHAVLRKDQWLSERDIKMSYPIFGKPVAIHGDNAREFRGDVLRRVCKGHDMDLIWRPVGTPHYGAHIERLNGTLSTILQDVAGTTYRSPNERLDYDSEGNATMTLDELEAWLCYRIGTIYHRTPHGGLGKVTPLSKLKEGLVGTPDKPGAGLPPMVKDERRLYLDFLPREQRTVQASGVVWDVVNYFSDELRPLVGQRDPDSAKKARKWDFARDDRQISPLHMFDPRVNDYIDIPYANLSRPVISVWELAAAKRRVIETGRDPEDEEEIFRAHLELKTIEDSAAEKTKAARLNAEKGRHRAKKYADDTRSKSKAVPEPLPKDDLERPASASPIKKRERRIFEVEERD